MAAVFPKGVKSFTVKRNLLDDVDANDINAIQDEIVALQVALGALINDVEELVSDVDETEDDLESVDRTLARNKVRFATLKDRLDYVHAGRQMPAIVLSENTEVARAVGTQDESTKPALLNFNAPPDFQDTHNMFNGTGFTTKQSGFWIIDGYVRYNLAKNGLNNANNKGMYQATVAAGDNWKRGLVRQNAPFEDTRVFNVHLQPQFIGYLAKGTRVTLRSGQHSGTGQTINAFSMNAVLIRRLGDGFSQPETSNNRFIL